MQSSVTFLIIWPEPYAYVRRIPINLVHHRDLVIPLFNICLVDAYGINPEISWEVLVS